MGHDQAGIAPTTALLDTLNIHTINGYDVRSQVLELVLHHLLPGQFHREKDNISDGAFRRLARKCDLDLLYRVAKADSTARTSVYSEASETDWFIARARELDVHHAPPSALLMGRHLIELGVSPGPQMGRILDAVYELQLDGKVKTIDEAIQAARQLT